MTSQSDATSDTARKRPSDESRPSDAQPTRPWRTEGLPKGQAPKPKPRWLKLGAWLLAYLVFFGVLELQDQLSGPQAVPYTEFKSQVAAKNVAQVFARGDSIEGELKAAAPLPDKKDRTYQQFTTERPTFAKDDL
jgi:cell division protease FtsH